MRKRVTALALALSAAAIVPAAAHHGWSGYDSSKLVTLEGTVRAFSYGNPHAEITLATADKDWRIVLAPPSRMERRGLARDSIKVEDEVAVEGYAHRQDPEEFRAERIRVAGKTVELR
jgi:hypothetical protein